MSLDNDGIRREFEDARRGAGGVTPIRLPSLEQIDRAVRELVDAHDYVTSTGRPAYAPGEFPVLDTAMEAA